MLLNGHLTTLINFMHKVDTCSRTYCILFCFVLLIAGFKGENRSKLEKRIAEEQQFKSQIVPESTRSTIDFAISTHKFFGTICLFLHGLTAGISMWQITIVYVLLYFDNYDFISHYQVMALPVQCMFYILLVLCTVSACDR